MHDYFFGAFVYLLRLDKLREWVEKKDAEKEARRAARREAAYQQGFNDGRASALNQESGAD